MQCEYHLCNKSATVKISIAILIGGHYDRDPVRHLCSEHAGMTIDTGKVRTIRMLKVDRDIGRVRTWRGRRL